MKYAGMICSGIIRPSKTSRYSKPDIRVFLRCSVKAVIEQSTMSSATVANVTSALFLSPVSTPPASIISA
ncbi:hypothetical protein OMP38_28190 [Cohnella ginsengisoli]|uniref:Uncharacterized protein n=1 Tax=Cohnella ginsengisoli TaxID=425004 RepID=A0A9X4QQZ1_9BACL|nr:hypothetical protein [Cohnella ginsengisoli]MDG0794285.1 hypothetical protein [Cohnella ginsengisoli]